MNRPIVIVDPLSSGIELAPALKARGVPAIAVTLQHQDRLGFGSKVQASDYLTSIGIVALSGDRESIFSDYEKIRYMESQLVIRR